MQNFNFPLYLFGIIVLFSTIACQDVIELDLDTAEPRLVIEGVLDATAGTATVTLQRTKGFYESNDIDYLSGASVVLRREDGEAIEIPEVEVGRYILTNQTYTPGEQYELEITVEGITYRATSTIPIPVALDSLEVNAGPSAGPNAGASILNARFVDPQPGTDNFYRIRSQENGELLDDVYTLLDDGTTTDIELDVVIFHPYEAGSLATVTLLSCDFGYYEYFRQLSTLTANGPNSVTPFNPVGNFGEEVLGYFGSVQTSTRSVVVE